MIDTRITIPTNTPRLAKRFEYALVWLSDRPAYVWRLLALALLALVSIMLLFRASIVVDGTRYFWLDDDEMISMRYARNLVEGYGLVWNPGERVEGYTNFLWTLVMAGVHLLPVGDANTAAVVKVINLLLACAVLLLSERLLRFFLPKPGLALPALLLTLAVSFDLLYWSSNGFETTLLTGAFLLVVVRILEESRDSRPRPSTCVLMGLLPLIRSDAYYVWAAAALLALGLSQNLRQTALLLGVSLVLPVVHLLFRYWYYGDWLPNTYYLKVDGVPGRTDSGLDYLLNFAGHYSVAVVLAVVGTGAAGDRPRWLLIGGLVIAAGYVLVVGRDLFGGSRFLAHWVPVLLVLAFVGIVEASRQPAVAQFLLLSALALSVVFQYGGFRLSWLQSFNGSPDGGTVTGVLIRRFTRPEAKVAVIAAGATSYFSHRYTIDLLGKSDRHIARLPAHPGGFVGHNKFDPEYSLGLHPDLVATLWTHNQVVNASSLGVGAEVGFISSLVESATFRRDYLPNPVNIAYLLNYTSVYIRGSAPEMTTGDSWQGPQISK